MAKKEGYSQEGLFGNINHYDAKGHKIGESRPNFFGGYTNYDTKGHKVGESRPSLFGDYTTYDAAGHKTGSVSQGLFGSQVHYDAKGRRVGTSDPGFLGDRTHSGSFGGSAGLVNHAGSAAGVQRDDKTLRTAVAITAAGSALADLAKAADARSVGAAPAGAGNGSSSARASASEEPEADRKDRPRWDPVPKKTVRYLIAFSPAKQENIYYRTNVAEPRVGDRVRDAGTGELVEVRAVVDCLEDALPPEANTTKFAVEG